MPRRRNQPDSFSPEAEDDDSQAPLSRSQRKRQVEALQVLGERLTELNPDQLARMQLSPALSQAIADYQRFRSREARRRQRQFIGSVMRSEDAESIAGRLEQLTEHTAQARRAHHALEDWRDRLIADDAAVTEYLSAHPGTTAQTLRHRVRRVRTARNDAQRRTAARALYRFLHEMQELSAPHDGSDDDAPAQA